MSKMLSYRHEYTLSAPVAAVADFHSRPTSMAAITPPPIVVQIHRAPARLDEGDEMEFTLWFGPLPMRWLARIEQVTPISFVDRQVRGPYARWVHHHTYVPVDATTTRVIDSVEAQLSSKTLWKVIGLGMWLGMPLLFAYRAWRTRRLLERSAVAQAFSAS
jgi:ligand-binding SRPBCC domain-containing protein